MIKRDDNWIIYGYTEVGGSAYNAGLENGDILLSVGEIDLTNSEEFNVLDRYMPGDQLKIRFVRRGVEQETTITLQIDPNVKLVLNESIGKEVSKEMKANRTNWLGKR